VVNVSYNNSINFISFLLTCRINIRMVYFEKSTT